MRLLMATYAENNCLSIAVKSWDDAPAEVLGHKWLMEEWREVTAPEVVDRVQRDGYCLVSSDPDFMRLGSLRAIPKPRRR